MLKGRRARWIFRPFLVGTDLCLVGFTLVLFLHSNHKNWCWPWQLRIAVYWDVCFLQLFLWGDVLRCGRSAEWLWDGNRVSHAFIIFVWKQMRVRRGLIDMPNVWFWCAFHLFGVICISHSGHVLIAVNLLMHCNLPDSHALQIKLGKLFRRRKSISKLTLFFDGLTSFISSSLTRLNFEAPGESKTYSMKQTPKNSRFYICHLAKLKIKELFSFQQSAARLIASLTHTYPMKQGNQSMITDKWWELKCVTDLNSCSIC